MLVSPREFSSLPWNELHSLQQESKHLAEENEQLCFDIKCQAVIRLDEECQTLQEQLTELKSNGKEQQQAHCGHDYSDVSSRQQQSQRLQIKSLQLLYSLLASLLHVGYKNISKVYVQ